VLLLQQQQKQKPLTPRSHSISWHGDDPGGWGRSAGPHRLTLLTMINNNMRPCTAVNFTTNQTHSFTTCPAHSSFNTHTHTRKLIVEPITGPVPSAGQHTTVAAAAAACTCELSVENRTGSAAAAAAAAAAQAAPATTGLAQMVVGEKKPQVLLTSASTPAPSAFRDMANAAGHS